MKKILSVLALSLVAVMLVSMLTSCSSGGKFVGAWEELDSEGEPKSNGETIVFASDGTGSVKSSGMTGSLKWEVEDGKLVVTVSVCGETQTTKYSYEFSGDMMKLTDSDGDETVYRKTDSE